MADPVDFFKAMNTSALIDAAKYGGYAPVDLNTLQAGQGSKLGGLADILLPALHAAMPNAPLFTMANAARQGFNVHQYNKQAQQQALYALQQEQLKNRNNGAIMKARTGMDIQGPFDTTFASNAAGDLRDDNAKPSLNNMIQGDPLHLDQYANYDPALVRDYLGQQSDATNFANQNQGLGAISNGQNQSLIRNAIQALGNNGVMAGSNGAPMLSMGVSKSAPPEQIDVYKSPYLMPTDVPSNVTSLLSAGLRDAQEKGQQTEANRHNTTSEKETGRHNLADEGIGRTNASAHMLSAQKSGSGGGSGNPFTIPNAMQTNLKNQIGNIENQLQGMGYGGSNGKLTVPMTISSNPKVMRAQKLMADRALLQAQMNGNISPNPAPFRNSAHVNLKQAGQNLGAQHGVVY